MTSRIYVEDLKENTNYSVKLSYPGVIPVQYEVFLEEDDSSPSLHRSVHQRRIQDTRLLSFRTDERSRIVRTVVKEDGTSHSVTSPNPNNSIGVLSPHSPHHPQTPRGGKRAGEDPRPLRDSRRGARRHGHDAFAATGESWIPSLRVIRSCADRRGHRCTIRSHVLLS